MHVRICHAEGLYFLHKGTKYLPGSTLLIVDIGTARSGLSDKKGALVCVTSNVNINCCRSSDGGNIGEWYFPNGTIVPRNSGSKSPITRSGFAQEVRLNRKSYATIGPLGDYECRVPDRNGVMYSASITLQLCKQRSALYYI